MPLLERFVGYYIPQLILDTLFKLHRETLKHLRFRSTPRGHLAPNELPWPSSIDNLETLPDRFPNLQSLGLDLDWIREEWVRMILHYNLTGHIANQQLLVLHSPVRLWPIYADSNILNTWRLISQAYPPTFPL